ncbi:phytanoyl-CoA dioxygenase [Rhodococcus erythropolis]|uniref:phytanoyl-CoA dioxygenase family protein n=1 Tax=Rhodococcus TaxID=1827 RepID=UPI0004C388C1|nr:MULTISPECIES: phytanoyl-CoA dioxygenase family protein [Rhodococcus]MCJ0948563.1 phytanoyl-CoA dioxygenase family protein [Rhodococcus sp. ARC_M8]QEX10454.1 phytanoyl-CoA dioxygenase [Rhodococcus erythropolis]UKO88524.1 phytanoyl-CoA dioxygenase family protein [Rhodococcus erythropolis]ULD40162.1 phytanoyl-CoA dioxygenase family protein [Rhodococcus qingshengii]BBE45068.1 phytanoyl-CoA dioxygenase [Rhodococcus erythropolis]
MTPALTDHTVPFAGRLHREDCNIEDFAALVAHETDPVDYPYAHSVADGVLLYHSAALVEQSSNPEIRAEIQDEIARALLTGPGITVFQGAFDVEILDRASEIFRQLIARQHEAGAVSGDHFAKPGANDRIWGAQLKLALEDPKAYVDYYANSIVALASEAWLGPMYQVTSDVNVVNPGGAAQNPHRDYHLGFMSSDVAAKFRAHVHRLTPALTLQGAVAHVDMPVETGPTKYLPYSQQFESGYLAFERPEFKEFFEANYVQLPLEKGDAVFFNPALFHAAGHNKSADVLRMANLLQVSSAFGRALGTIDRDALVNAIYPALLALSEAGSDESVRCAVAASAEGYAFPTNLDRDQPIDGLAPQTQAELVMEAVRERISPDHLAELLKAQSERRMA